MVTNAFRATLPDDTPIGLCFEPTIMSLANHSCIPNALVIFDGRKMSLRALYPIKTGEQVLISYVDTTQRRDLRQNDLQNRYFFTCHCEKCENSDSPYFAFQKSPITSSPRLDLLFPPSPPQATATALLAAESSGAFTPLTSQEIGTLRAEFGAAMRKAAASDVKARLNCVRAALHRLTPLREQKYFAQQPYPSLLHEAYLCYVENRDFLPAVIIELFELFNCDVFNDPQPHHPVRVTRLFIIARLLKAIAQVDDIEALGKTVGFIPSEVVCGIDYISAVQAVMILVEESAVIVHGTESRFVTQVRGELSEVEAIQKQRGDVGEILKGWQAGDDVEAVAKGNVIAGKLFGQLSDLAGYALDVTDKKSYTDTKTAEPAETT